MYRMKLYTQHWYSWFHKAELRLGLGWGHTGFLTVSYTIGVSLIDSNATGVRLTHSYITSVTL